MLGSAGSDMGKKPRDPKLDLAKAVLICLVVLGHYLEAADGGWRSALGDLLRPIYMVHMPAFVFLAGITARGRGTLAKVVQWLTLLVVFSAIYIALDLALADVNRGMEWDRPYWILWFLLALAVWQALTPLVEAFPKTFVAVSVGVALFGSMIDSVGYDFSLSRIIVFWPFFVVGKVYGRAMLEAVDRLDIVARIALVGFAAAFAWMILQENLNRFWLYGSRSFDGLAPDPWQGMSTRILLGLAAFIAMFALWAILPRRDGWFTLPGQRSLAIYLLHGIPVTLLTSELKTVFGLPGGTGLALLMSIALTAGTVALFTLPFWDKALRAVGTVISRHIPVKSQPRRSALSASS